MTMTLLTNSYDTGHWSWLQISGHGTLGTSPYLHQHEFDILEVGERAASCLEDDAIWGAPGIIFLMAAPGGHWENL